MHSITYTISFEDIFLTGYLMLSLWPVCLIFSRIWPEKNDGAVQNGEKGLMSPFVKFTNVTGGHSIYCSYKITQWHNKYLLCATTKL